MNAAKLADLARLWRRRVVARDVLFALAAGCAAAAIALPWNTVAWWGALVVFGMVLALRLGLTQPWQFDAARLARYLNHTHAELEESSELWLRRPESLTLLERLQRRRVDTVLERWPAEDSRARFGVPPPRFLRAAVSAATIAAAALAGTLVRTTLTRRAVRDPARRNHAADAGPTRASATPPLNAPMPHVTGAALTITPPAYTGRAARRGTGLNAEVEEGALVSWRVMLDAPARDARLVFGQSREDALPLQGGGTPGEYEARRNVSESSLYHLSAMLPDGAAWNSPEVYSLKVVKDLPPVIRIVQPEAPRTEIAPPAPADVSSGSVLVEAAVSDDYGIASARIVATVAKGSGEAVKFREQSIPFDTPMPITGQVQDAKACRFSKTLDLNALGLEPGDELYFHIEAVDNRQPAANRTRSETRFVVLKGPEMKTSSTGQGVAGVNLVPQYFRSERQIIIDTEKLIADQAALAEPEFRRRSNDLGIDQQLLRLRYGQFLGEELEQGQGAGDHNEINLNPLEHGVPRDLIHQHDTAPEPGHGGNIGSDGNSGERPDPRAAARTAMRLQLEHAARAAGQADDPDAGGPAPAPGTPLTAGQVVAPFVDQHHSQDKATLFDHEEKGTMRDALAAMWEAEGFLRTARPREALVPAHRALAILKAIQQSARAYVQHVGFDPPPLKEDTRRLDGDASDVPARQSRRETPPPDDQTAAAIRAALRTFPWSGQAPAPTAEQWETLRRVEPVLTAAGTREPGAYLAPLQTLRTMAGEAGAVRKAESGAAGDGELAALERALLRLLPPAAARPVRREESSGGLAAPYFEALGNLEAKP